MDAIGYLHLASIKEGSESPEVFPIRVNFKFANWSKLCSAAAMPLLSIALTMGILCVAKSAFAVHKVGTNGSGVTSIQRCLSKLGYFQGPITGKFGSLTHQAVTGFQQANQLPADGVVGNSTQTALQQTCQSRNIRQNSTNGLQRGSTGPAVSRLQQRLQQLGYYQGPITGYFGPKTEMALARQRAGRLPAYSQTRRNTIVAGRTRQANLNRVSEGGEYPLLSEGSSGEAVLRLQQRLQELRYFNGNPTGNFGEMTRDALIAFQRNSGIPVNGIANQQTWNALLGYSPSQVLVRSGLSTEQVRELQDLLGDLGYFRNNPTGYFGPQTRDALIRFQRDYRLSPDGIADMQALVAARQAVSQARKPKEPTNQVARNYLTVGDSGENVKAVQERLLQIGFFNANPDGYFGENTRAYVYAFQEYSRINPTGIVDSQTWQALGLNTSPLRDRSDSNRYVVVVPIHNSDTLNKVRQYIPNPQVQKSGLGDYINAGAFGDRSQAENVSKMLRSYGLDARVQYF